MKNVIKEQILFYATNYFIIKFSVTMLYVTLQYVNIYLFVQNVEIRFT